MSQSRWIYLQLALGMVLYGSATPISRIISQAFPVFLAPALRMGIAALILTPLAWSQRDALRDLKRRDWLVLGGIALSGMFGFSVLMLLGMKLVSGVVGSIIMSTTPAVTAVGAFLFLGDQMGWRRILAVVLAVIGVLILQVSNAGGDSGSNLLLGSALVFAAVCCEASFTLLGTLTSKSLSPLLITTITSLMAAILFLPLALWDLRSFDVSQP
ncbi:MAG: DMT family transporter, partial [Anaerolineae bacterium]|nr:DMT family transporter [Anaerolineae bacterium]